MARVPKRPQSGRQRTDSEGAVRRDNAARAGSKEPEDLRVSPPGSIESDQFTQRANPDETGIQVYRSVPPNVKNMRDNYAQNSVGPGALDTRPGQQAVVEAAFAAGAVSYRAMRSIPHTAGPEAKATRPVDGDNIRPRSFHEDHFPLVPDRGPSLPGGVTAGWGQIDGKPTDYPTRWTAISGKPTTFQPAGHGHSAYSQTDHGHPGKADNPHGNGQHTANYALATHNHSQSVKLMSKERRRAAVALRERLRGSPTSEDLANGLLFVMGLLFDDAGELLDETLERDADEQLVRHLWESSMADPGDVEAPPENPHPDIDRITNSR